MDLEAIVSARVRREHYLGWQDAILKEAL